MIDGVRVSGVRAALYIVLTFVVGSRTMGLMVVRSARVRATLGSDKRATFG